MNKEEQEQLFNEALELSHNIEDIELLILRNRELERMIKAYKEY